jgi:hypothetical protein
MRIPLTLAAVLLLPACASGGGAPLPQSAAEMPAIPEGAVESMQTAANGDTVYEYRVSGQLRMVKVVPARGPTYYLVDRNGDGKVDVEEGEMPATYFKLFEW